MNSFQATKEISEVNYQLAAHGLDELVDVRVEVIENEFGKKTPHLVARYTESCLDTNESGLWINDEQGNATYKLEQTEKFEEMNKWFDGQIFAMGITQRAAWLKATHEERVAFMNQPGFKHPANFPVVK